MSKHYNGIIEIEKLEKEFDIVLREYENRYKSYIVDIKNNKNIENTKAINELSQLKGQLETILTDIKNKTNNLKKYEAKNNKDITQNMSKIESLNNKLNNIREEMIKEQIEYENASGQYQDSLKDVRKNNIKLYLWLGVILVGILGISKIR